MFSVEDINGFLNKYKNYEEPKMIEYFCNDINGKLFKIKNKLVKIITKVVHRKPFVQIDPPLTKSGKLELGDILLVLKDGTQVDSLRRASVLQVKKGKVKVSIPMHQWIFYRNIESYYISLGNNFKREKIRPKSKYFLNFLICHNIFLMNNLIVNNREREIYYSIKVNPKSISLLPICKITVVPFNNFIFRFTEEKIGERLQRESNIRTLVKKLLEFVGLCPDPSIEFEDFSEEGIFAVIILEVLEHFRRAYS